MAGPAVEQIIAQLDNDLPRSTLFREKVPALTEAFDAERMSQVLEEFLIDSSHYSIMSCTPGKALYLPDHIINMQYRLSIQDHVENQSIQVLVNARLFQDLASCKIYLDSTLMPIASKIENRPETRPFIDTVAIIERLKMAVAVFPIDGLNPTLVEATDPSIIAGILAEALPEVRSGQFIIQGVRLLLAHYGRYKRCVLRYSIEALQSDTQTLQNITVYGKVDADGLGGTTVPIISALRESLQKPEVLYRFRIPHSLGYFPDLKLLMMEALPGKPFFKELLKTWKVDDGANQVTSQEGGVTLEQAVRTCALIAATLHSSKIKLGPATNLEMQVAKLRDETDVLSYVYPELGAQIDSWISQTVEFGRAYPAMPVCFSHGDFTYTQLIFDEKNGGLVDFDSICQAEPAQDLGHYLAYQRLNIIKDQDPNFPFPPGAIERLCALFLDTYIDVSRAWIPDEAMLRGRVAIYELISLIRLALHSWEKIKGSRLKQTLALLEERIECQKQISLSAKNKTA
jgi:hypothetical protein